MKDPEQFRALHAYSPYHHVRDGVAYPAILLMTGANDARVNPMQSRKMTARLQAAGARIVLLRTTTTSGHGPGTRLDDRIEQEVDALAFFFDQLQMGTRQPGRATDSQAAVESFTIESKVLHETRQINVYTPPGYTEHGGTRFPVLYMPDGGMAEDFPHVTETVQTLVAEGTMRPFLVVGIANTERRRDMTGPTQEERDKKIAVHVGGSAAFRQFLREELMPQVRSRYHPAEETAIVGESLAGLFIVETFLLEPDLFDTYIAFSPSVWWNDFSLVRGAADRLKVEPKLRKTLYITHADEQDILAGAEMLAGTLRAGAPAGLVWFYRPMPDEHHGTIYIASAPTAFRTVLGPSSIPAARP